MRLLDGIDEDTVDFIDNYSGEFQEPVVLPARFPNLLVNGSQGIAVGMATNIPPHNLGEVIDATVHLLDNPDGHVDDLMPFVKGPDFPTGALIMGRQGILDAYRTGKGSIRLRAVAEIEEGTSGRTGDSIVVTEMPYQTSISATAARIKELVETRADRGHRRRQRRVGPGQDPPRDPAEEGRPRPGRAQQPLQAHASCSRTSRSTPSPSSTACPARSTWCRRCRPTSTTRSRSSAAAPSSACARPRRTSTSARAASRPSTSSTRSSPLIRASDDRAVGARSPSWPRRSSSARCRPRTSSQMTLGQLTRLARVDLERQVEELRAHHRRARRRSSPTRPCCAA